MYDAVGLDYLRSEGRRVRINLEQGLIQKNVGCSKSDMCGWIWTK